MLFYALLFGSVKVFDLAHSQSVIRIRWRCGLQGQPGRVTTADQSELSLKGCKALCNPIQYQYCSTTERPVRLAADSFAVITEWAICHRPPSWAT